MKPAPFDYHRAESIPHACDLLAEAGADAKLLAGGQTLIPMMNFRLARPAVLIDIGSLPDRNQVTEMQDAILVRATSVHAHVEKSPVVQSRLPMLHCAVQHIAHCQIRNKGTMGGSIANADPAAELPAMSLVLDAALDVVSRRGRRCIEAADFYVTYMTTALEPDEIVQSVRFALPPPRSGWGFAEVARRSGDYALAGSTAVIGLDEAGHCSHARVVLFGVAPTPVRVVAAEEMLLGERPSPALMREAAALARSAADPEGDVHVTAAYRRDVAGVLAERVLNDAVRRAGADGMPEVQRLNLRRPAEPRRSGNERMGS